MVDQWKAGGAAELRVSCESGHLRVSVSADFGPANLSWRADSADGGSASGSPCRQRRRERRAAARAAAEKAGAKKITASERLGNEKVAIWEMDAEEVSTEKSAAEKCAKKDSAEKCEAKKAAEKCATQKAAALKCAAEKAATEKAAATVRASTEEAEKAAAECALTPVSADVASTSCLGGRPTPGETCWNCEVFLTPDHQCDGPLGHISGPVHLFPSNPTKVLVASSPCPSLSAPAIHQCDSTSLASEVMLGVEHPLSPTTPPTMS